MYWPHLRTRQKIALASLAALTVRAARRLTGRGPITTALRDDLTWSLDLREGIDFAIYLLGRFEASTARAYERIVRPGDTVLDIGANVGAHTLPLARLVGAAGQVIAFEPTKYAHDKLLANLNLNPSIRERVVVRQMLLTALDETGPLPTHLSSSWPLISDVWRHEQHGGVGKETTGAHAGRLDTYLETAGICRVDFMKLDVDGHECAVLDGATATISRYRPIMALEIAPYVLRAHGTSAAELSDRLSTLGYSLFNERTGRLLPNIADWERILPHGASLNVLARPGSHLNR